MTYSELQEKGFALAARLASLSLEERLGIIARTFGCETASVETSACRGGWRGYTDIYLVFDNNMNIGIGNCPTREAQKDETISECVNYALARYHPDIVAETKERAAVALLERETADNEIAAQKGLKPYTFLNVELIDGGDRARRGFLGWYYVTLEVDDKIIGLLESGLESDIYRGVLAEKNAKPEYYVAGGLEDADVDFVFGNIGHSTSHGPYLCDLTDDIRARAEKKLHARELGIIGKTAPEAGKHPQPARKPSLLGKLEQNKQRVGRSGANDAARPKEREV